MEWRIVFATYTIKENSSLFATDQSMTQCNFDDSLNTCQYPQGILWDSLKLVGLKTGYLAKVATLWQILKHFYKYLIHLFCVHELQADQK